MMQRLFTLTALYCLGACASSASTPASKAALELSMTRVDGRSIELRALRGQAQLLFLFTTYDEASQFALVPISRLLEQEQDVQVLGIAVQPDAKTFLTLFARSLSVPFELYYEPNNQLLHGETALGPLRGVPAFVALDASGQVREVYYGIANLEKLRKLAELALGR
jgi:hypothetical protein